VLGGIGDHVVNHARLPAVRRQIGKGGGQQPALVQKAVRDHAYTVKRRKLRAQQRAQPARRAEFDDERRHCLKAEYVRHVASPDHI